MLSTPDICCSMGVATDCSTVRASAPVKLAVTTVSGVTMSGNRETGRKVIETAPAITANKEMTIATIGRLTKNLDIPFKSVGYL